MPSGTAPPYATGQQQRARRVGTGQQASRVQAVPPGKTARSGVLWLPLMPRAEACQGTPLTRLVEPKFDAALGVAHPHLTGPARCAGHGGRPGDQGPVPDRPPLREGRRGLGEDDEWALGVSERYVARRQSQSFRAVPFFSTVTVPLTVSAAANASASDWHSSGLPLIVT